MDPAPKMLADTAAFLANIFSSVLIIFVNKKLMDPKAGYGFMFGESCYPSYASTHLPHRSSDAFSIYPPASLLKDQGSVPHMS